MTERDYSTYEFIISYIKEHGYSPTLREIACGTATGSTSTVTESLRRLQRAGRIETKICSPRAIKVIGYDFVKNAEGFYNGIDKAIAKK